MGDPRNTTKKFATPRHPWQAERIESEKQIVREYGLKNKSEIYKITSSVKRITAIAKRLIASTGDQAELEKTQLFAKLHSLGLLAGSTNLDDVLSLQPKDLLERRLQTIIWRKGLARSAVQARQFIAHQHIKVAGRIVSSPGYIVTVKEEAELSFVQNSTLSKEDHPERVPIVKKVKPDRRPPDRRDNRRRRR